MCISICGRIHVEVRIFRRLHNLDGGGGEGGGEEPPSAEKHVPQVMFSERTYGDFYGRYINFKYVRNRSVEVY